MSELVSVANTVQVPDANPTDYVVPQPVSTVGLIAFDNFDNGGNDNLQTDQGFYWVGHGGDPIGISSTQSKSGGYSNKFMYDGRADCLDGGVNPSAYEQFFNLGGHHKEVWFSFDFYVPSNFVIRQQTGCPDPTNQLKFFSVWSGATKYSPPSSRTGPLYIVSLHYQSGTTVLAKMFSYIFTRIDGDPPNHDSSPDPGGLGTGNCIHLDDRGTWQNYVIHMKEDTRAAWIAATGGDPNVFYPSDAGAGVLEVWRTKANGSRGKIVDLQNLSSYANNNNTSPPSESEGFNAGYQLGPANSGFDNDTDFFVDNFTVSTNPLGGLNQGDQ